MDLHVRLTWLLLLSTTLLTEPANGAWWDQPESDLNSLWKKITDWFKSRFENKDTSQTTVAPTEFSPAPSSTPAQTETPPAPETVASHREDVSSAPSPVTEEMTTLAPEIPTTVDKAFFSTNPAEESRTPEAPDTPQTASENTSEPQKLPAALVSEATTPASEILSTLAEAIPSPTAEPADVTASTVSPTAEPADVTTVSPSPAPADITTTTDAAEPADVTASTVSPTAEPADVTTAPAEDTTPEAEVTTVPTTAEIPVPSPSAASVPSTPETTTTATTQLIPLPEYMRMMLLKYLNSLCQPRRPGMPRITLEGCVSDPTCGNNPSSGQRLFQLHYKASVNHGMCLRCKVLGCNILPPPRPFPGNLFPLPFPRPFPGNKFPLPFPRLFPGNKFPLPFPRPFPRNKLPSFRPFPVHRLPVPQPFPGFRRRARSTSDGVVVVFVPN
ncbi:uncharacterized protein [Taeniopygia guttata]|uniref:uncharacterized protein isoform X10 n=1 Tax=Taeniopygia guttata TaxID=59729 RepID=UPI003BB99441